MGDHATTAWRRQYGMVYRFVRRRAGSREDAEDVTQDVYAAAVAALGDLGDARLQAEAPPLAWLYTVARRRLVDRLRMPSALPLDREPASIEERSYGPTVVAALVEGLQTLGARQRRVVVLKLFEGRSFAEIAVETGASEEACRMQLSRGLAALRRYLIQKGVSP